jgi:hypothetical protein
MVRVAPDLAALFTRDAAAAGVSQSDRMEEILAALYLNQDRMQEILDALGLNQGGVVRETA